MLYEMSLDGVPFDKIAKGEKTIELRLCDEKRKSIRAGDYILFTDRTDGRTMFCAVKRVHKFDSFNELYASLPLDKCGYSAEAALSASPDEMLEYYSAADIKKYGVVGIELAVERPTLK